MNGRCEAFAALHQPGRPLFLPNAWDYVTAMVLAQAGYPAIGTTSLGVAASAGKPDGVGATREVTLELVRRLADIDVLLTVDIEFGFGDDPDEVARFAGQLAESGAVGINLEDGRPDHTVAPASLHMAKIAAIKAAAPGLYINARTDLFWLAGNDVPPPISETRERATSYIAAGADGIYVPGVTDLDIVETLASHIDAPLNVLYLPGVHTFAELARAGVGRVSTGSLLIRESLQNIVNTAHLAHTETVPLDPHRLTVGQVQARLASEHT